MKRIVKMSLAILAGLVAIGVIGMRLLAPAMVEKSLNVALPHDLSTVSYNTKSLHTGLTIMDWHADSLLWDRDLNAWGDRGHVDVPRLQAANMALQMFTMVTKSPSGQNYHENTGDSDNITLLAMVQGWPVRTWNNLFERGLYQARKLDNTISASNGALIWVRTKAELAALITARRAAQDAGTQGPIGALLGAEGAQLLEGKVENLDQLQAAGMRMLGLAHFFDNEFSGSLHGQSNAGLSEAGVKLVARADALEMIIDLAHASEATAWSVLALSRRAPVVSHTGFRGACDSERNFPDALMKAIAMKGGLIGVGFWDAAVCDPSPRGIANSIQYGINLVGADHVALGSDLDGSVAAIPVHALPLITQALADMGVAEADIRKVMGENSVRFLATWLPEA